MCLWVGGGGGINSRAVGAPAYGYVCGQGLTLGNNGRCRPEAPARVPEAPVRAAGENCQAFFCNFVNFKSIGEKICIANISLICAKLIVRLVN